MASTDKIQLDVERVRLLKNVIRSKAVSSFVFLETKRRRIMAHITKISKERATIEVPCDSNIDGAVLVFCDCRGKEHRVSFLVVKRVYWKNPAPLSNKRLRSIEVEFSRISPALTLDFI